MQIKTVDIKTLKPWPGNPRAHDRDIDALMKSVEHYGWTNPILVQKKTGRIIAGHGRYLAAKKKGLRTVPVLELDLNDQDAAAYTIADNKLAENSAWDLPKLKEILVALDAAAFDVDLTGFTAEDITAMFPEDEPLPVDDAFDPTPPKKAVVKLGDLWALGTHRLLCGDSTAARAVEKVSGGRKAMLMWTDPPYGVEYVGKTKAALTIQNDGSAGLPALLAGAFSAADKEALADGAAIYIAHPAGALSLVFGDAVRHVGWRLHQTLSWVKDSMVLGHSDYHYKHEPIFLCYKAGGGRRGRGGDGWYGSNAETSVLAFARPKRSEEHPTMKPLDLVAYCIKNSAPRGGGGIRPIPRLGDHIARLRSDRTRVLRPRTQPGILRRHHQAMGRSDRPESCTRGGLTVAAKEAKDDLIHLAMKAKVEVVKVRNRKGDLNDPKGGRPGRVADRPARPRVPEMTNFPAAGGAIVGSGTPRRPGPFMWAGAAPSQLHAPARLGVVPASTNAGPGRRRLYFASKAIDKCRGVCHNKTP